MCKSCKEIDGRVWHSTPCNPTMGWKCQLTDRVSCLTWQFGDIHQCKVYIQYDKLKPGPGFDQDVGFGLDYRLTELDAMRHCVEWAEAFIKNGPPSPEQVFEDCFKNYPTLFKTRLDVISQLFFTIGNGYEWFDGAIVCTGPEDHLDNGIHHKRKSSLDELYEESEDQIKSLSESEYLDEKFKNYLKECLAKRAEDKTPRPMPDDGGLRVFYPVCEYSEIERIPDDVRPEWLALAYEAALILRDRSGVSEEQRKSDLANIEEDEDMCAHNREIGARIVQELEEKYPFLKKSNDSMPKLE